MLSLSNLTRPKGDPKVLSTGPSSLNATDKLAKNLGWFSIGLGLTELFAARTLTRALGIVGMEGVVRAYGAREIAAGMTVLSTEKQVGLMSRVAGDALDIITLVSIMGPRNRQRHNVGLALAIVVGVTMVDIAATKAYAARHARKGATRRFDERTGYPGGVEAARGAASDVAKSNIGSRFGG